MLQRNLNRTRKIVAATAVAGGPFFFAAKKFESDAEDRCRYGRSRRAILYRHDDCAASIRKSGPEIKNQCTNKVVSEGFLASIPQSGPEIKNRCTQEGVNGEKLASIPKFGLEIKNHCIARAILEGFPAVIPQLTP